MAKIKIGLDAGHGGSSTGTYSSNTDNDKLYEKDYCLELTKMVAERLEKNGVDVFLTRTKDINPGTVSERAKMCVDAGCGYAVSLHFNGFANETANGCEVFVPYKETNASIEVGYLNCLAKYFRERKPFARSNSYYDRNETFDKKINVSTNKFDAVADKKEYFGFIRDCWENGVSADLLEICFLTNKEDFEIYIEYKSEIADGIAKAIIEGCGEKYQEETEAETAELVFKIGDFVEFVGNTHYTSANAKEGKACKPGPAKITGISKSGKHPYHAVRVVGNVGTVYGWVDAKDVKKALKKTLNGG